MGLRVVVVGATGVFGSRIARRLAHDARFELILAARRAESLESLYASIGDARLQVATLDAGHPNFRHALAACRAAGARFAVVAPEGAGPDGAGEEVAGTRLRLFDLRAGGEP